MKNTTEVLITFFSLWDPVSSQYEVTDVIDGHSLVYGRRRLLDVDYLADGKAYPHGYFLMEHIIPLPCPQWYERNCRRELPLLRDCALNC